MATATASATLSTGAPGLNRSKSNWVSDSTDDINAHYTLGKKLGQPGQFGFAQVVTHKATGQQRAVKVINKARFSRSRDKSFHFQQLRYEIEVMKKLNHKNIIKMYEVFETLDTLYIVMELCVGGELFDRIKSKGAYSEKDASLVLRQMLEGVAYMHQNHIAHCDLKPDNFLFLTKDDSSQLKIIDFGMSKFVQRRKYFNALCGTPYYVAPEVLNGRYSEHCDLWSIGVVMFVMLFGYPPFYADQEIHGMNTDQKIFDLVKKGFDPRVKAGYGPHFPESIPCSEPAKELIARLLTLDTAKRITAGEALDHPWMTGKAATQPLVGQVLTNLSNFSNNYKLKQALLSIMSDSLNETELANLKKTFLSIDENGDGVITVAEMKKAVAKAGAASVETEQLLNLFKSADIDGDGQLSYSELLVTAVQRKLNSKEERMWNAFCKLDLNMDGKITKEEIATVLQTNEDLKGLIAEADTNNDGSIDYEEFITMWSNKQAAADASAATTATATATATATPAPAPAPAPSASASASVSPSAPAK